MPILLKNQFVNSREEILEVETPQPLTETHVPIEHSFFLEQADKNFEENNLTIKEENFWLSRDHKKYAGIYTLDKKLRSDESNLNEEHNPNLMLSFINSNDKTMSAGVFFGTVMPICTNVGWWDSFWIKRKHIGYVTAYLEEALQSFFSSLEKNIIGYNDLIQSYKDTDISDLTAKGIIVEGAKQKVMSSSKIIPIVDEWETPSYEYDDDGKNLYRLHNSFTTVLKTYSGNPIMSPKRSFKLINVLNNYTDKLDGR